MNLNKIIKEVNTFARKKPGRIKYKGKNAEEKINNFLAHLNLKTLNKFKASSESTNKVKATKILSKFKPGKEWADTVKSAVKDGGRTVGAGQVIDIIDTKVSDSDVKTVAEELVNLTTDDKIDVKEDNKSDKEKNVEISEPLASDADDDGLDYTNNSETQKLEEAGADVELK